MVIPRSLSDSKSPQVSKTLLNIMAVFKNAVVWIVSTRPPTSKFSSSFSNPIVTIPEAPITIGIIVTFMFHSLFKFPNKVLVLVFIFSFFQVYSMVSWKSKVDNLANSLFFFGSVLLAKIRWYVCMSKPRRSLCVSFSTTDTGFCIYPLLSLFAR